MFNFLSRFVRQSSSKKPSRKGVKVNHRKLCFETLESRELLAVTTAEFATIRSQYADLNLSANMADYNVIEITAAQLSVANLKSAITTAGTTTKGDLIVLRTTATQNKITYASSADEISINFSASSRGSVTIVSLGTSPLTIDAAQKTRGVYVASSTVVALAGLTITGGSTSGEGGGIYINGTLMVTNCTISENYASYNGGGIHSYDGSLTVTNSTISGNTARYGGGICNDGTLMVTNSTISGNTASDSGGGIYSSNTLTITSSMISGNNAFSGGGICNDTGTLTVTNSTISGSYADASGGGIYSSGTLTITNSTISGNNASSGGGIYSYGTLIVTNCTISGNAANYYGGGIYYYGTLTITNSTISGNNTYYSDYGGGIYSNGTLTINNSIVARNSTDIFRSGGTMTGSNNIIGNGSGQTLVHGTNGNIIGTAANPIDPKIGELTKMSNGQLVHPLLSGSLAIDAGNSSLVPSGVTTDQAGKARVLA